MSINSRYRNLFGFTIDLTQNEINKNAESFVPREVNDGGITISTGGLLSNHADLDANFKNDIELITRYREISQQPEIDMAIEDIVNEAIVLEAINNEHTGRVVEILLDNLVEEFELKDNIQQAIKQEFNGILKLLDFNRCGYDLFKRFYVDGRLPFHKVINNKAPNEGIQELRYIDPRRLKKITETKTKKDQKTGADIVRIVNEYYIYNDKVGRGTNMDQGVKITPDSVAYITSGLVDPNKGTVLSYVHKAIRPLNLLRMITDATIIHKVGRSTNRRIFYVDLGGMSTPKGQQYIKEMMTNFKNKVVYDPATGSVRDDRKTMSILEDYWIPRRNSSDTTEIKNLPGDDAGFNDMSTLEWFQKELYKSLHVPLTRMLPQETFNMGTNNEISRDEIKFNKYIERMRVKFSRLFENILGTQLVLKGICTAEEYNEFKQFIYYQFGSENYHEELVKADILKARLSTLMIIDPYEGKYYSKAWIQKNVLQMNDDDIREVEEEMANDKIIDTEKQAETLKLQLKYGLIDKETGQSMIQQ